MEDVWSLSKHESSEVNCRRLERLWQEELNEVGPDAASPEGCVDLLPYQAHPLHRVPDDHAAGWLQWTKFSGWLYSAVRMRESSWAESLAKSSAARSLFLENFLYCRLTATSGALTD